MHSDLGIALAQMGQPHEAEASFREAIRLQPDHAEAYNNLGIVLNQLGKPEEALAAYRQALRIKPDYAECYYNRNLVLKEQRKLDEAVDSLEQALRIKPDYPEAHWDRAVIWLLGGDFERGWPEYEWRWKHPEMVKRHIEGPLWDGSALQGRTILVYAEQGFGDAMQFIRFVPRVKQLGGTVLVEGHKVVVRLLGSSPGIDRVVVQGQALPPFDLRVPLLSLPGILKTTAATIPADVPYLFAEEALVTARRRELGPVEALKLGIVWQGRPTYRSDPQRSVPLTRFLPLAPWKASGSSACKGTGDGSAAWLARCPGRDGLGEELETSRTPRLP